MTSTFEERETGEGRILLPRWAKTPCFCEQASVGLGIRQLNSHCRHSLAPDEVYGNSLHDYFSLRSFFSLLRLMCHYSRRRAYCEEQAIFLFCRGGRRIITESDAAFFFDRSRVRRMLQARSRYGDKSNKRANCSSCVRICACATEAADLG